MVDCTLEASLERNANPDAVTRSRSDDGVKRAGAATRARIEEVFSRQAKVTARLRSVTPSVSV